jgi:hypothetical protein
MRISRSVIAVGGVVLAAVVIGFTNPKTVHAVAAALVQVTNTASNPVVNAEVTLSSSQLVQLDCNTFQSCSVIEPGGVETADAYVIPAGQTLVITDVEIHPPLGTGTGVSAFGIFPAKGTQFQINDFVTNDGVTHHFTLGRGVVFPSGTSLFAQGSLHVGARLLGYLTDEITGKSWATSGVTHSQRCEDD